MREEFGKTLGPKEILARYVMVERDVRSDGTVKPDAFVPCKHVELSVTRHVNWSQEQIWDSGRRVAHARNKPLEFIRRFPGGVDAASIRNAADVDLTYRTLQRRLNQLVDQGRIEKRGRKKGTRYFPVKEQEHSPGETANTDVPKTLSEEELEGLHMGNIARYRLKPGEFEAWKRKWGS